MLLKGQQLPVLLLLGNPLLCKSFEVNAVIDYFFLPEKVVEWQEFAIYKWLLLASSKNLSLLAWQKITALAVLLRSVEIFHLNAEVFIHNYIQLLCAFANVKTDIWIKRTSVINSESSSVHLHEILILISLTQILQQRLCKCSKTSITNLTSKMSRSILHDSPVGARVIGKNAKIED